MLPIKKNGVDQNAVDSQYYSMRTSSPSGYRDNLLGINYVGGIGAYSTSGAKAVGNGSDPLFTVTYKNVAILNDGTRGDLVLTFKKFDFESKFAIEAGKPINVVKNNQLSTDIRLNASSITNADISVAAYKDERIIEWDGTTANRNSVGVKIDFDYAVLVGGQPYNGLIAYSVNDLDVVSVESDWRGTNQHEFSEGLTVNSGAKSYAVVPRYDHSDFELQAGAAGVDPLAIVGGNGDGTANGVRFYSQGRADLNTFDTGFATILDSSGGSMTWTGATRNGTMGTTLFDKTLSYKIEQSVSTSGVKNANDPTGGTGGGTVFVETYDPYEVSPCSTMTPNPGTTVAGAGETVTHKIKANYGYHVDLIVIDGTSIPIDDSVFGPDGTYTKNGIKLTKNPDGTISFSFENIGANHKIHVNFVPDAPDNAVTTRYVKKQWFGGEASDRKKVTLIATAYRQTPIPELSTASAKNGWYNNSSSSLKGIDTSDTRGFVKLPTTDPYSDGVLFMIRPEYYPADLGIYTALPVATNSDYLQWTWDASCVAYISQVGLGGGAPITTVNNSSLAWNQDDLDAGLNVIPAWLGAELDKDTSVQTVISDFTTRNARKTSGAVSFQAFVYMIRGEATSQTNWNSWNTNSALNTYKPSLQAAALLPIDGYDYDLGSANASPSGYTVKVEVDATTAGVTESGNTWEIAWPTAGDATYPALPDYDADGNKLYWFVREAETDDLTKDWEFVRYQNQGSLPITNYGTSGVAPNYNALTIKAETVAETENPYILGGSGNSSSTTRSPGHTSHAYLGESLDNAGTIANQKLGDLTVTKKWYEADGKTHEDTDFLKDIHLMASLDGGATAVDVTSYYINTDGTSKKVQENEEATYTFFLDKNTGTDTADDYVTVDKSGKEWTVTFHHLPTFYFGDAIDVTSPYNYGADTDTRTMNRTPDLSKAHEITYYVVEGDLSNGAADPDYAMDGYKAPTYVNNGATSFVDGTTTLTADQRAATDRAYNDGSIANTQLIKVNVVKIWDDADNQDGMRADIGVTLYQNGTAYEADGVTNAATLSDSDSNLEKSKTTVDDDTYTWTEVFVGLPFADENGSTYNYTATETTKPEGYDSDQSESQIVLSEWNDAHDTLTFTITNKHDPDKTSFTITKVWNDANNKDVKRPTEGEVSYTIKQQAAGDSAASTLETLPTDATITQGTKDITSNYSSGVITVKTDSTDGAEITVANLPANAKAGKAITYTLEEVSVSEYTSEITGDATTGFTVKNTHVPEPEATPLTSKDGQYNSSDGALRTQSVDASDAFTAEGTLADGTPNEIVSIKLKDPTTGGPTDNVTIPGEGTYTIDATGVVTFTPEDGFTGKAGGVTLVGTDKTGATVETTYTPIVVPNKEVQTVTRTIEYKYVDEAGNEVTKKVTQTATLERIGDYNPALDDHKDNYQDTDSTTTIGFSGDNNGWTPQDLDSVTSPADPGGWVPDQDEIAEITGITPDNAAEKGFTKKVDPTTGAVTWTKEETVIYNPEDPIGKTDETWGFPGNPQTSTATSLFEVTTSQTAADDEGNREDNAITPDKITLIDPDTGEETNGPIKAYAIVNGVRTEVGTYKYDPTTGEVTFTPNEDFQAGADPEPCELKGTDKNGRSATAYYQPHFVPDSDTVTLERTINYVYDDGTPVLDDEGNPIVVTQTISFTREATSIDPVTHEPVWGDWQPASSNMDEVSSPDPDREGYVPGQETVEAVEGLTQADFDKKAEKYPDVTIVYTKPPVADEEKTFGPKGEVQKGTPPFTEGSTPLTSFTLIDPETGEPVDKITVPGEGTYTIDKTTGEVSFTPEPDFVGTATKVTVRGTDENGNTADGYYTPTVIDPTETKTVKRTIEYKYDDGTPVLDDEGNPKTVVEEKTFTRTGTVDPKTGTVTYPDWEPQTYNEVPSDDITGYTPDKSVVDSHNTTPPDGDETVTVVYSKTKYTVIFENGDHGKSTGGTSKKEYGDTPQDNTTTPDDGYKFTGSFSYVITDNDGNVIDEGTTDDPASITVIGNIVFTPVYEKLPHATYIDPATGRTIQVTTPFVDENTEPPAPEDPTREGYSFVGWDREVDEEGNVVYKAKWEPVPEPKKTYWVTYIDPATGRVIMEKTTQPVGASEPSAPKNPTRDGYTFAGWDRTVDADGNVTYTAKWTAKTPAPFAPQPAPTIPNTGDVLGGWSIVASAGAALMCAWSMRRRRD